MSLPEMSDFEVLDGHFAAETLGSLFIPLSVYWPAQKEDVVVGALERKLLLSDLKVLRFIYHFLDMLDSLLGGGGVLRVNVLLLMLLLHAHVECSVEIVPVQLEQVLQPLVSLLLRRHTQRPNYKHYFRILGKIR